MIEKGSFETTRGNLENMLRWISAPLGDKYDKAWLNLQEDTLHAVANVEESVVSYCSFQSPMVENIFVHDEYEDSGMESLINTDDVREYLNFVGGKKVKVTFFGNEDEKLCRKMEIDGDLTVTIYVPNSEAEYESKQTGIVNVYNEDERWCKPSNGEELSTHFTTRVEDFKRIVQAKEFDDFAMTTYPVTIENGEFVLNATDDNDRNSISGSLYCADLEGPDVDNSYVRGFQELFNNISGEVEVGIEQDTPISIVRRSNDDAMTLRYTLIGAA
jgi:hypothetical protein